MYQFTKEIQVDLPDRLTNYHQAENYMILDIETTGLSRDYAQVILVGMIYFKEDKWWITQIFCDHRREERDLLLTLRSYIKPHHLLVTYNGHAFDIPFLNARYDHNQIEFKVSPEKHFDLYRVVRASKKALNLANYKLKTIEEFLGIYREDQISGKESVDLYNLYEQSPSKALRHQICLHNYEDILLMVPTLKILDHVPQDICDQYFPMVYKGSLGKLYLTAYKFTKHFLEMTLYTDLNLRAYADYRQGFSFQSRGNIIEIKVPKFAIGERNFIDVDDLPFGFESFNDLDLKDQLSLELSGLYESYINLMTYLDTHYLHTIKIE